MRTVIIHGTLGSPESNWFRWLSDELELLGSKVSVPPFPTPEGQSIGSWLHAWDNCLRDFGLPDIVIGHSLGGTFLLRVLERCNDPFTYGFIVSGFDCKLNIEPYDTLNDSFVTPPWNWKQIKEQSSRLNFIHGDNDPYVPLSIPQRIASLLDCSITVIPNGGHLNSEVGMGPFPLLLDLIKCKANV